MQRCAALGTGTCSLLPQPALSPWAPSWGCGEMLKGRVALGLWGALVTHSSLLWSLCGCPSKSADEPTGGSQGWGFCWGSVTTLKAPVPPLRRPRPSSTKVGHTGPHAHPECSPGNHQAGPGEGQQCHAPPVGTAGPWPPLRAKQVQSGTGGGSPRRKRQAGGRGGAGEGAQRKGDTSAKLPKSGQSLPLNWDEQPGPHIMWFHVKVEMTS